MCPMCDSTTVTLLGILGKTNHVRCRMCGWTFSITDDTIFENDSDAPYWAEED